APAASSGDGGEEEGDFSSMWDEAFAEQEAATTAVREGAGEAGDIELDAADPDALWEEALSAEGGEEAAAALGAEEEEPAGEAEASGDIVSQDELDSLLEGGGDSSGEAEEESAPGDDPGGFDLGGKSEIDDLLGEEPDDDSDEEEIEAYVPVEEGAAEEVGAEDLPLEEEAPAAEAPDIEEEEEAAQPAGVAMGPRLYASLVDTGVLGVLMGLFAGGTHFIVGQVAGPIFSNMEALILVLGLNFIVFFLLSMFYSVYFVGFFGRTPGHRIIGLRVVDLNDKPVGYMQAILRYFGGLLATSPLGLGHLLVIFDKRGRGLGDRFAGTKVVGASAA
ncbi:MAG: RDD family protein, partial [bacterium]